MTEDISYYVDRTIDKGQNSEVDLIIVNGVEKIHNQIRFSQNKIDINKQWSTRVLEVLVVINQSQMAITGFTPSSDDYVDKQLEDLINFANKISPSPFYRGVEKNISSFTSFQNHSDPAISEYSERAPEHVNAAIDRALEAGATRVAGSYLFGTTKNHLASSAGPRGEFKATFFNLTVRAFQEELDASGQGLACGRMPTNAEKEILKAGETAGEYSKKHRNAKQVKAGTYDVVMLPAVAANLLGSIPTMANPLSIMMGMSALGDKMGEKLAPEFISISDDGLIPEGLASSPFDIEGTPRQTTPIIKDGVLVNFIHNTSTAELMGSKTTGNSSFVSFGTGSKFLAPAPTNLVFENGDHSFEELLQSNRPTIFVTCNWYTRYTSRISTEYSTIPRDAAFLVENGELSKPIKNFRISDNLLRQFLNIEAVGKDRVQVKWWEVSVPTFISTIRVKDCRITTATQ
ncbi:MAG: TldD/PmbA family protein [Candidatus Hodarchaeales archaeon]